MFLPFTTGLIRTTKFDVECSALADRHYSRKSIGEVQFAPPGETIILRDSQGLVVFVWRKTLWKRWDNQEGVNCTMFRNEGPRRSSEIILEAEMFAAARWGNVRVFTFVDSTKIRGSNPGCCFKKAGWKSQGLTKNGKHIFDKLLFVANLPD